MIASLSWEDEMSLDDRDSTLRPKLHKMEHKPAKVKVEVDVSESDTWDELTALHDDSSVVEDLDTDLAVTLTDQEIKEELFEVYDDSSEAEDICLRLTSPNTSSPPIDSRMEIQIKVMDCVTYPLADHQMSNLNREQTVLADEAFPAVDLIKLEPTNIKVSCDHPDVLRLIKMTNLPTWGTRSKRSTKRKRIKKSAKPGSKKAEPYNRANSRKAHLKFKKKVREERSNSTCTVTPRPKRISAAIAELKISNWISHGKRCETAQRSSVNNSDFVEDSSSVPKAVAQDLVQDHNDPSTATNTEKLAINCNTESTRNLNTQCLKILPVITELVPCKLEVPPQRPRPNPYNWVRLCRYHKQTYHLKGTTPSPQSVLNTSAQSYRLNAPATSAQQPSKQIASCCERSEAEHDDCCTALVCNSDKEVIMPNDEDPAVEIQYNNDEFFNPDTPESSNTGNESEQAVPVVLITDCAVGPVSSYSVNEASSTQTTTQANSVDSTQIMTQTEPVSPIHAKAVGPIHFKAGCPTQTATQTKPVGSSDMITQAKIRRPTHSIAQAECTAKRLRVQLVDCQQYPQPSGQPEGDCAGDLQTWPRDGKTTPPISMAASMIRTRPPAASRPESQKNACSICSKVFQNEVFLMKHTTLKHPSWQIVKPGNDGKVNRIEGNLYQCTVCSMCFTKFDECRDHYQDAHELSSPYKRPEIRYQNGHSGPFGCQDCGLIFDTSRSFNSHKKAFHSE